MISKLMQNNRLYCLLKYLSFVSFFSFLSFTSGAAEKLQQVIDIAEDIENTAVGSQKIIDKTADQSKQLLQEYRAVLRSVEFQKIRQSELESLKQSQQQTIESLKTQLDDVKLTQHKIMPMLRHMVESLDEFVSLDLPFQLQQRKQAVEDLKKALDDPQIKISERAQRVWQAYQQENNYGRTIESYRGALNSNEEKQVEFLRIGRMALYYLQLDGKHAALWDSYSNQWIDLSSSDVAKIKRAIRVAKQQTAPQLLPLPLLVNVSETSNE